MMTMEKGKKRVGVVMMRMEAVEEGEGARQCIPPTGLVVVMGQNLTKTKRYSDTKPIQ